MEGRLRRQTGSVQQIQESMQLHNTPCSEQVEKVALDKIGPRMLGIYQHAKPMLCVLEDVMFGNTDRI